MNRETAYVLWFDELKREDVNLVGGKSSSLGELTSSTNVPVPYGFATTAYGYREFMKETGLEDRIRQELDDLDDVENSALLREVCTKIRRMICQEEMPAALAEAIRKSYEELGEKVGEKDPFVAVRSSATAEDLPDASFAGQQDTYLNVRGADTIIEKVKECYASTFTDRATYYRVKQGFDHMTVALSAAVQMMVFSKAAGVMFTVDLVTGNDNNILIEGSWGLGEYVVQGTVTPDNFRVDKQKMVITNRMINDKNIRLVRKADGDCIEEIVPADEANKQVISDEQVLELAEYAKAIEKHYGCYMDMEWGVDERNGKIWILQARPETVWSRKDKSEQTADTSVATTTDREIVVKGLPASPGKAAGKAHVIINPEDIESMSVLTGAAAAALYGSNAANGAIVITTKKGKEGRLQLTVSQNTEFMRPFRTPEFQNRYGTGDNSLNSGSVEKSWGNRLNSSNYMGYNPISDFLQTGVVTTESVTLSTGTERNQTYFSASAVNSKGMIPNNNYNRYNFTFRNTTSFLQDKMTLDVSSSYIKQNDRNMVNQGTYSNPLVTAYLFPRGNDWNDIKMYERYDVTRKINTQYWPESMFSGMTGQNPYWIAYRNLRENDKDRYMLSASLNYKILDWLSVSGRVRMDNSTTDYTKKLYATSNKTLTEESNNGLYGIFKTTDKQTYADIMVNVNKNFGETFSLSANIGASYSDMKQDVFQNEGPISNSGIPNVFNV